jgi:hypothetical protein
MEFFVSCPGHNLALTSSHRSGVSDGRIIFSAQGLATRSASCSPDAYAPLRRNLWRLLNLGWISRGERDRLHLDRPGHAPSIMLPRAARVGQTSDRARAGSR